MSLKKHANSLLLTLWICKPSLANNVELRQIVNHENDSILFPTLWGYQNTNSSDQTMLQFSQGYCCNGLCICHLRQIRSYLLSKHFKISMHFRGVFEILKTFQFGFDRHLLVWEYDLVTSRISKREKCVLYDFFHCNIYNISLIKKVQTTIPY